MTATCITSCMAALYSPRPTRRTQSPFCNPTMPPGTHAPTHPNGHLPWVPAGAAANIGAGIGGNGSIGGAGNGGDGGFPGAMGAPGPYDWAPVGVRLGVSGMEVGDGEGGAGSVDLTAQEAPDEAPRRRRSPSRRAKRGTAGASSHGRRKRAVSPEAGTGPGTMNGGMGFGGTGMHAIGGAGTGMHGTGGAGPVRGMGGAGLGGVGQGPMGALGASNDPLGASESLGAFENSLAAAQ